MMVEIATSSGHKSDILQIMKGVTIMIIASVVWSIVSGIIAKKKAEAKKLAAKQSGASPQIDPSLQFEEPSPAQIRIESLRRKKKKTVTVDPDPVVQKPRKRKLEPIKSLHTKGCPLPPVEIPKRHTKSHARQIATLLSNRRNLRTAIVLSEILSKPVSQRN
jgi:hypothetical protein